MPTAAEFHLTYAIKRSFWRSGRNFDGACKAESLNRCYVFFLQEKIAE